MSALDDTIALYNSGHTITPMNGEDMQRAINSRLELAQLRDDSLLLIGSNRLLNDIGALLNCAPDSTILDSIATLHSDLQAAQEQIAWLTSDIGESGLAAINRLIAACNRMDIPQQYTPDLNIARDEILRQARQLEAARNVMIGVVGFFDYRPARSWLAANPAPEAEPQP